MKIMTTLTIEISETLDKQVSVVAKRSKLSKEKLAARVLQDFINRQTKNGSSKQTVPTLPDIFSARLTLTLPLMSRRTKSISKASANERNKTD